MVIGSVVERTEGEPRLFCARAPITIPTRRSSGACRRCRNDRDALEAVRNRESEKERARTRKSCNLSRAQHVFVCVYARTSRRV